MHAQLGKMVVYICYNVDHSGLHHIGKNIYFRNVHYMKTGLGYVCLVIVVNVMQSTEHISSPSITTILLNPSNGSSNQQDLNCPYILTLSVCYQFQSIIIIPCNILGLIYAWRCSQFLQQHACLPVTAYLGLLGLQTVRRHRLHFLHRRGHKALTYLQI